MPSLELDQNTAKYQIRAYKPGYLKINEAVFNHSVIVMPDKLIEYWQPQSVEELSLQSFVEIIALAPDVLLIGTGETHTFLPVTLYGDLINRGIGVEIMETGAACRTFNALSAENRNVAAALLIK